MSKKYDLAPNQRMIAPDTKSEIELYQPLHRIYDRVINVVKRYPSTKGNYIELVWRYYKTYYPEKFRIKLSEFQALLDMPSPESITRLFRKAVENNEIEITIKTNRMRNVRETAIRHNIMALGIE